MYYANENKKTKVLQVNKLYYPYIGGIESTVQQIAEGLSEKVDMNVIVCSTGRKTIKERVNGVNITRAGSFAMWGNLPLSLKVFKNFYQQARNCDVLLFHMPYPIGDLMYLLSGIRNKKLILWWHSDIVRQKKLLLFYKPLMRWFLKKADSIIVATEGHISGSQILQENREKCVIIPFGLKKAVEEDSYNYIVEKNACNSEKNINFLFVGRLVYYKGCDVLIRAFEGIEGCKLVIAGEGPLDKKLKKMIIEKQMQDRVILKKKLSDEQIMKEYRNCDVFVLPSVERSEAFGLVQIEAMAYGKPVINTMLPSGVPYVSLNGITGLTVLPGNVDELENAMLWMQNHPKERQKMGRAARKRVEEEYLQSNMLQKVLHELVR